MPVLSVIVPVYNRKKYIRQCVNSILAQSYKNFEIILVDDGSYDGTSKICDLYAERYPNVKAIHQKNEGVSKARNTGIRNASGQYCIFIDSDDHIPPNYFLEIKRAYEQFGNEFQYLTSFRVTTNNGINFFQFRKGTNYSLIKGNDIFQLMDKALFNSVVNKVYCVSILRNHNILFPEGVDLGEDLIFNLKYFDKIEQLNFIVLNKTFYEGYMINSKSLERSWRIDYFEVQQKLLYLKIKFVNRWIREEKLPQEAKKFFLKWYADFINENIDYYRNRIKYMSVTQMITMFLKIKNSSENLKLLKRKGGWHGKIFRNKCKKI